MKCLIKLENANTAAGLGRGVETQFNFRIHSQTFAESYVVVTVLGAYYSSELQMQL